MSCRMHQLARSSSLLSRRSTASLFFSTAPRKKKSIFEDRERPPPISVDFFVEQTENAAIRIKNMLSAKDDAIGVKIGVKRRGCNGYSYTMDYANASEDLKKYEKVDSRGVQVFVDPMAIFYILGTEMDFVETALSSEFTFFNPNSKGECGCGESFNV